MPITNHQSNYLARDPAISLEDEFVLIRRKQIKVVEVQRSKERRSLFEAQDAVVQQGEALIDRVESKRQHSASDLPLFAFFWTLS